jgi:hypothetical protein
MSVRVAAHDVRRPAARVTATSAPAAIRIVVVGIV